MAGADTQVALLMNADTGEHCVAIAHGLSGGRVVQAHFDSTTARAIAADLIRFADECDAMNARADAVTAQLLEKYVKHVKET